MKTKPLILSIIGLLLVSFVSPNLFPDSTVGAISGQDFQAGHIIDDTIFYDGNAMSSTAVQSFLNAKVPTCDTNGTVSKSYYYDSNTGKVNDSFIDTNKDGSNDSTNKWVTTSRAIYGARYATWYNAHPYSGYVTNQSKAPFVCLRDYRQDTPQQVAESGLCGNISAKTDQTAAKIITAVSNACGVSPKVLLVLLHKEQGLVYDSWPWKNQYAHATGFACPDTHPCNPAYSGFFYQVYNAAYQFRKYRANPTNYGYIAGRTNYIRYSPDASCGGSNVYIQNQATAGLYNYTPYQPNAATLKVGLGVTAPCGAYGNKNFWWYFTAWFGSTYDKSVKITRSLYFSPGGTTLTTADSVAVSFIVKNVSSSPQSLESIGVAVRDQNNNIYNYPFESLTLQPGQSYTYYKTRTFPAAGTYRMWIANKLPGGDWSTDWPYSSSDSIVRSHTIDVAASPNVTLSRSLYFSRSDEYTTEDTSAASFIIKNNEAKPVTLKGLSVAAEHENGNRYDFPSATDITLQPGEEYQYYGKRVLPVAGKYTVWVQAMAASGRWSTTWPENDTTSIVRQKEVQINAPPNITMVRHLYVSPKPILAGQQAAASFIIKNNEADPMTIKELAVRVTDSKNAHHDFPSVKNITLNPGQEYTYYQYNDGLNKEDTYTFWVGAKVNTDWTSAWPKSASSTIIRKRVVASRLPNITLIRKMYHSPSDHKPTVGQTNAVSFVVKNNEDRTITLPPLGVAVRNQDNDVVNFPFVRNVTLNAGETYTYYQYRTFDEKGTYRMWIAAGLPWGGWSSTWPYSSPSSIPRTKTITVY